MKHTRLIILFSLFLVFCVFGVTYANPPYVCGSDRITGQLTTSDPEHTTVVLSIKKWATVLKTVDAIIAADGSYEAPFDPTDLEDALYTIESVATLSWLTDSRTYETYIGKDCGICGNGYREDGEMCETNDDCAEWLFCGACSCVDWRSMRDLITAYANEVADFKSNQAEQVVPKSFVATWWPFAFVDSLIKKLGVKFASSKSSVYHTVPERTLDPTIDVRTVSLESVYASLPPLYQNKQAYLRFKWLFVPIETAWSFATHDQVLEKLNQWAVIAPETPSLNTLWAVKMVYTHALSFTDSPFAGIGSYLSVFWSEWDTFYVYIRKWNRSYEQRTYTIKAKFQIAPEKTDIISNFKKEGADSLALITCRDGDVLWSTKAREIILAERISSEMGDFQKAVIALGDDKQLANARKKIDAYLEKKDLSEEQVVQLVTKLEKVADKGKWNALSVIATYGKYMAAYDAVYN